MKALRLLLSAVVFGTLCQASAAPVKSANEVPEKCYLFPISSVRS